MILRDVRRPHRYAAAKLCSNTRCKASRASFASSPVAVNVNFDPGPAARLKSPRIFRPSTINPSTSTLTELWNLLSVLISSMAGRWCRPCRFCKSRVRRCGPAGAASLASGFVEGVATGGVKEFSGQTPSGQRRGRVHKRQSTCPTWRWLPGRFVCAPGRRRNWQSCGRCLRGTAWCRRNQGRSA
jgi:hypothetical protein